jgi:divalent metal cation (Fe/Co/Zn/Cd) transporter
VAAENTSEALNTDALHFGSDMWSSLALPAGLIVVAFGHTRADSAAAIIVAAARSSHGRYADRHRAGTVGDVASIPGVVAVERIQVRQTGKTRFASALCPSHIKRDSRSGALLQEILFESSTMQFAIARAALERKK